MLVLLKRLTHLPIQHISMILLCVLLLSTVAKSATVSITTNASLQYYLCCRGHLESHTTLVLSHTVSHVLSPAPFCLVSNLTNITLRSQYKHAVITCSSDNIMSTTVGFGFYNVSELSLINIDIRGCGGVMPSQDSAIYTSDSAFYFPQGQSATLIISKCSNITLTNVAITEYYGYAIVFINPNGSTSVYNITIMNALGIQICYLYMYHNPPLNCSGSGVVLYYYHDAELSLKSKVVINTGLLKRNWVFIDSSLLGELDGNIRRPISSFASDLTIIFSKGNYEAHVLLRNVQLFKLNFWPIMPKMALIFYNSPVQKCHIDIIGCKFSHHEIDRFMDVQFYFETQEPQALDLCCEWNAVSFYHCLFHDTLVMDAARFRPHNSSSNTFIKLSMNSKLSHNISVLFDHAYYEAHTLQEPPFIAAYDDVNQLSTKSLTIVLNNFYMTNYDKIINPTTTYNARLIFINIASVIITGNNNLFEDQADSIIEAYNTDIHLKGTAIFRHNSATNGAAVQLSWPSCLYIYESTKATFLDNKVSFYGGAIYSYTEQNLIFNKNTLCAIQIVTNVNKTDVSQIGVLMRFINNTADRSGNSIYASPLYNCKQLYTNINNEHLYAKVFEISSDNANEISSVPVSTVLCDTHGILRIYPGFTSILRLKAIDLSGTVIYANIEARIHSTIKHKTSFFNWLPQQQRIQTVTGNGCTELHYTLYPEGDVDYVTLHFSVVGNTLSSSVSIQILPCPPGFYYNTLVLHHSCTCSPYLIRYNIRHCDIDTTSITVSPQSWLGVIPNSTLAYAHCPSGYCTNSQTVNVTRPHHMCSGNREGTLCGECVQGYSVIVGSNTCHTCSDKSWYIVLVYLVGSVVYVFLLYLLRLTIDEGTLGGLVFWLDLTDITSTLKTDNSYTRYLVSVMYLVKYKWKFPNLCYYNGLNMLGKSTIAFTQPLVLWTLVGIIVLVSRYSQKVSNMTVGSSVQVLATLMYVLFSELLINSVIVLTPAQNTYITWTTPPLHYLCGMQTVAFYSVETCIT